MNPNVSSTGKEQIGEVSQREERGSSTLQGGKIWRVRTDTYCFLVLEQILG